LVPCIGDERDDQGAEGQGHGSGFGSAKTAKFTQPSYKGVNSTKKVI